VASTLRSAHVFKDPALPLQIERVPVDWNVADHAHEFQELVYVEKGRSEHEVALAAPRSRASRYELLPGDCFIIAPQERHAFLKPRGLVVWNLLFLPELVASERARLDAVPGLAEFLFIEPLFRHEGSAMPKLHLGVEQRARALACLEAIKGECARRADGYVVAARAHFLVLLIELARAWSGRSSPSTAPAAAGQRQAIDAAIAFMEERYGEDLSLKDIAAQAYLSPHHFSETFKRACGMPPFEFLLRLRLDRAKELLRATERSVTDIALSVGFGDSSYFARVFKAQVGKTPRAWREAQG
jgi:AraC family L-rhamnose operon transcriptional activator RhaR